MSLLRFRKKSLREKFEGEISNEEIKEETEKIRASTPKKTAPKRSKKSKKPTKQ